MNSLTTRKIVLGILMALVLTFSVQGIADAITITKVSGDRQFIRTSSTGREVPSDFIFKITDPDDGGTTKNQNVYSSWFY